MFNKVLNTLRNPNIHAIVLKKKKFQFLIEQTDSRLHNPGLHDYYCTFKNTILFNSRYINYDPHAHEFNEFKNTNFVNNKYNSNNNNLNMKYTIMNFGFMNNRKGGVGVGLGISGRKKNSKNLVISLFNQFKK